jgi:hypothetical protein
MTSIKLAKLAIVAAAAAALAGCVDLSFDVDVLGDNSAKATMVTSMDKALYDQSKDANASGFCDTGTLDVGDKVVTCTEVHEGTFADVFPAQADNPSGNEPQPSITSEGNGLYRVSFPTGSLKDQFSGSSGNDEQMIAMMKQMFTGHMISMTVHGSEVTDTNMTKSDDGRSATFSISFDDLFAGAGDVPDEAYAVVRSE